LPPESSLPNTTVITLKHPVSVCAIITPWNFPAAMITRMVAPAFAAGCSVVIKPPSETPYSCLAFVKLEAANRVRVVATKDRDAATELATNPIIKKISISFTGSTGVS
jgi:succinate-semialdehyde dehydrogenase/glutarate-semialdehyde dehydrogenase